MFSPYSSTRPGTMKRSGSARNMSGGSSDDAARDGERRRHPDQLSHGRRRRSLGAPAAWHLLEPGLEAGARWHRRYGTPPGGGRFPRLWPLGRRTYGGGGFGPASIGL